MNRPERPRDPYEAGMIATASRILREALAARFVGVLDSRREGRGLHLIHPRTRCIRRHDVHEVIVTDEPEAAPGGPVNRCHYLGFVEFQAGGLLVEGDRLNVAGRVIGAVAGFDESHFPNHYNIVVKGPRLVTGIELGQKPGDELVFIPPD
ncbi:MAG: hypothetical protein IT529_20410 [Burkholderiales bacterium]|nr:hypothetical protein [Burkholderiales bacterium]